jgi:hypothetical protein
VAAVPQLELSTDQTDAVMNVCLTDKPVATFSSSRVDQTTLAVNTMPYFRLQKVGVVPGLRQLFDASCSRCLSGADSLKSTSAHGTEACSRPTSQSSYKPKSVRCAGLECCASDLDSDPTNTAQANAVVKRGMQTVESRASARHALRLPDGRSETHGCR